MRYCARWAFAAVLTLWAGTGLAEERVALVLGNSTYRHAPPLANAAEDGRSMAGVLRRLGFTGPRG